MNRPQIIATEDASTLNSSPVTSGAFYAYRITYPMKSVGGHYKVVVELHEAYPNAGRIWKTAYNPDYSSWDGWHSLVSDNSWFEYVNGVTASWDSYSNVACNATYITPKLSNKRIRLLAITIPVTSQSRSITWDTMGNMYSKTIVLNTSGIQMNVAGGTTLFSGGSSRNAHIWAGEFVYNGYEMSSVWYSPLNNQQPYQLNCWFLVG